MLVIKNYKDIKITKICSAAWNIYNVHFFYEGQHYLLHHTDDEDDVLTLYAWNENKLTCISSCYGRISDVIRYKHKHKYSPNNNYIYKHIDLFYFVLALHKKGLIVSTEFSHVVEEWKSLQSQINVLFLDALKLTSI